MQAPELASAPALSPSDGTISLAHHEIVVYSPTLGAKRRVVVQGPNPLSVVPGRPDVPTCDGSTRRRG